MYAIYDDIYHQDTPVMLAYIPYMDTMGDMKSQPFVDPFRCGVTAGFPTSMGSDPKYFRQFFLGIPGLVMTNIAMVF